VSPPYFHRSGLFFAANIIGLGALTLTAGLRVSATGHSASLQSCPEALTCYSSASDLHFSSPCRPYPKKNVVIRRLISAMRRTIGER